MHWVEDIIEQAVARKKRLAKFAGAQFIICDWKTPSGPIHIGSLRGALVHDEVFKALAARKKPARYIFGFDDFDPMDKLAAGLPKSFEKYLGMPFSKIPAPRGSGSYAEYFANEFKKVYEKMGVKSETLWTSRLYKSGKFNCAFDIVIENAEKIRQLYKKISGQDRPKDWLAVQMVCQKCGKIGTTRAFDFKDGKVLYICDRNYVRYAKGCGWQGSASPYDGAAKLPWKVEWAAKWFILATDIEGAGKDHQTKGGSHDLASAILRDVFGCQPPVNIFYEFFLLAGKKMSTSRAIGLNASELTENIAPALARFMILKHKPESQFNLNLDGEAIPRLYDDWDQTQNLPTRRADRFWVMKFSKVAFLIQMPHIDLEKAAEKEKGAALTGAEKKELKERVEYGKIWLTRFADARHKFILCQKLPPQAIRLNQFQKDFLVKLLDIYQTKRVWNGEDLHSEIHQIKTKIKIDAKPAFQAIYQIFLGRSDGPPAGWFLAGLERQLVIERITQAVKNNHN